MTVTAPASFRFTQEATPERHRQAAHLLTGGETEDLGEAFAALMQDVGAPMTISELGYTESDIPALVDHYRAGRLRLDELITARYPLDRLDDAIAAVVGGEALRNVIVL